MRLKLTLWDPAGIADITYVPSSAVRPLASTSASDMSTPASGWPAAAVTVPSSDPCAVAIAGRPRNATKARMIHHRALSTHYLSLLDRRGRLPSPSAAGGPTPILYKHFAARGYSGVHDININRAARSGGRDERLTPQGSQRDVRPHDQRSKHPGTLASTQACNASDIVKHRCLPRWRLTHGPAAHSDCLSVHVYHRAVTRPSRLWSASRWPSRLWRRWASRPNWKFMAPACKRVIL